MSLATGWAPHTHYLLRDSSSGGCPLHITKGPGPAIVCRFHIWTVHRAPWCHLSPIPWTHIAASPTRTPRGSQAKLNAELLSGSLKASQSMPGRAESTLCAAPALSLPGEAKNTQVRFPGTPAVAVPSARNASPLGDCGLSLHWCRTQADACRLPALPT